jgi:hypothetical protein
MTDIDKPINDDAPKSDPPRDAPAGNTGNTGNANEASRTLLAGVVGGVVSAAAYLIYTRLPEEQRDKLHAQGRALLESRINELRSRFNI